MNTPWHPHSRAKRKARRKGKSHGRQNFPNIDWSGGPVPYLDGLRASFEQQIRFLDQKMQVVEGQSITSNVEDIAEKQSQEYEILQMENERAGLVERLANLVETSTGELNENPMGRSARRRHVPILVYALGLIALGIGEFFVTLPAVNVLLNDEGWKAWVITGSFSALSILASHIIGLTLKIQIDRDVPQPVAQKWGSLVIGTGLMLVVLFLSSARSKQVGSVPVKFWMSDKVFGTVLFFFVQMTFILCAVALSYYNHSEIESDIARTKRAIKRLTRKIRSVTKSRLIPERGNLSPEKRVVQMKAILVHKHLLDAQYRELCSIYRGANLLAQKVSFTSPGSGLTETELNIPLEIEDGS